MGQARIHEGYEVDGIRAHGAPVVVEAGLPGDQVLDVLDYELRNVRVRARIGRRAREAEVDGARGHRVRHIVIRVACRVHVERDRHVGVLGAREAGGKDEPR